MVAPATPAPSSPPSRRAGFALTWSVILLALALRLMGIRWGLPHSERFFSFHPDENDVVAASLRAIVLLDPGFYNYGTLPLLLNGFASLVGTAFGVVGAEPARGVSPPGAFLVARFVTALLGAATCGLLLATGRRLYSLQAGVIAALLYAVAPLAVQHGHFATVDVPATFFVAVCLFFTARYLSPGPHEPAKAVTRHLLWAGIGAGLAGASKYNGVLVALAPLAAFLLTQTKPTGTENTGATSAKPALVPGLLWVIGGAILGFVAGCPPVYLNPQGLMATVQFEANHVREGHGDVFTQTLPGVIYHAVYNLPWSLGWPATLLVFAGIVYALRRRSRADVALLAFALPYYILIGLAQVKFARYNLPLFPPFLLLAGALVPTATHRSYRPAIVLTILSGVFALVFSLALNAVLLRPDPRDQAAQSIRESGVASVGFATGPWFYSPPLGPFLSSPRPQAAQRSTLNVMSPRLLASARFAEETGPDGSSRLAVNAVEWDTGLLAETNPQAVVLSEFEYADSVRIGLPETLAYLQAVQSRAKRRAVFQNPVQVFGIPLAKPLERAGLPAQPLPHDMTYTNPVTVVEWFTNSDE